MKASTASCILTVLFFISSTFSLRVLPDFFNKRTLSSITPANQKQEPIMNFPNIALPPFNKDDGPSKDTDQVIISDVIGKERIINIFAGFTRDVESLSRRLENNEQNSTVLAPLNSEIQKLPRKPWEDPKDYEVLGEQAYDGSGGEERAQRNLRRFAEAHIIPASPWKEGEKVASLGGGKLWWEERDGTKVVQPGNIEVSSVAEKVANGEVWVLKGVVNYES
ncbi:hypothetical protein MMC22_002056 [Lobaria immixta]|nr:hypothetical protein [Lobaria immixta]